MKKAIKRIITCILIFTLIVCTVSADSYAAEDYRTWVQGDSRWGSIKLGGSSYTMKKSGCLVTASSKMIIQSGVKDVEDFNPEVLVRWLNKNGGLTSGGAMSWVHVAQYSGLTCKGELVARGTYSSAANNKKILDWLKSGYHVILNVDNFGHFIVVDEKKSLETGTVYIMDSIGAYTTHNVKLASRYPTFNRAIAYVGGVTPLENLSFKAPEIGTSVSGNSIAVSWNAVPSAQKYIAQLCDKNGSLVQSVTVTSTNHTFKDVAGGDWKVRVASVNAAAIEAFSAYKDVSTHQHSYDAGIVTREATDDMVGALTRTCTSCGATKIEVIQKLSAPSYDEGVERIWGKSRYHTALATADALKAELGLEQFDTVIIANGENFPDALAGSSLATKMGAPILMTNDNPENITLVQNYITANLKSGGKVYVLGGTAAVPASIENSLKSLGYKVDRLKGKDRYATSLAILEESGISNEALLICTGTNFADSLSGSATGLPILLVNPFTNKLTDAQKNLLDDEKRQIYIIGGEGAVSDAYLSALAIYDTDGTVERIKGTSRYETSIAVAEKFFANPEQVVAASATNFPDGLCGGPVAYYRNTPLILTGDNTDPAAIYLLNAGISSGKVLGGEGAVSESVVRTIFYMGETDEILGTKYN